MGCALALPLVSWLVATATADVELGIRAEERSSVLAIRGVRTRARTAVSATPTAALVLGTGSLRLTGTYEPAIWTSDVAARTSPLVNQAVGARLEAHPPGRWSAMAAASAIRGRTDPLADPVQVALAASQLASTDPLRYEEIQTRATAELRIDPRTTVAAGTAWSVSRGADASARALLPLQRGASVDVSLFRRATERDTLRFAAFAGQTVTATTGATTSTETSTASATWRRLLSPRTEGWLGGGATLTLDRELGSFEIFPAAEGGVARAGDTVRMDISARVTTVVDRFTGEVSQAADAATGIHWTATQRVSLSASGFGGARVDGRTALAGAELRARWTLRPQLALEAGIVGRWQHERRTEFPSFAEGGLVLAVRYTTGRPFGDRHPGEPRAGSIPTVPDEPSPLTEGASSN